MLSIKEAASRTNTTPSTIRYYDGMHLLEVQRDAHNHRIFNEDDLIWISMVTTLRQMNMSIHSIRRYVYLSKIGKTTLPERLAMMTFHQEHLLNEMKRAELRYVMSNRWIDHYVKVKVDPQLDKFPTNVTADFPNILKRGFDIDLEDDSVYK
ncbi:MerR family transcriptional regulator [Lactiplantibacillus paraplantarum]|uniref:MerR family transcriptional regulator n=1 Tax=Lactiplantibacillus paraplantarum TaxID=60520 RepID=UPI000513D75B|nr:MerR family transcriptional regulator [Lactiplantibacillus paraplantarum]ALO03806.1 hypothetical protein ASU28_05300 [Lactiplantibacillus paraplantarum]KGE76008.1 hypothetical protein HR47_03785 [Lactiplantibacillus paraplantarum]OAX74070.1 hypothetical protein A0U96_07870 [Lactiplantibacillus plantarum]